MADPEVVLYTLGGAFGMRSVSPFCLKIEMALADLALPYQLVIEPDPRKAPKGKMPWASINGQVYADSEIILEGLDELTDGRVYGGLSSQQRGVGLGLLRLAEEHLYWLMVAARWLDEAWWPNVKRDFMGVIPMPFRAAVSGLIRRRMRQTYQYQGLGLHTPEEQQAFAARDLQALQDAVGSSEFLFGEKPCAYDFGIASIMAGLYDNVPETSLTLLANRYTRLKEYAEEVQAHVGVFGRYLGPSET